MDGLVCKHCPEVKFAWPHCDLSTHQHQSLYIGLPYLHVGTFCSVPGTTSCCKLWRTDTGKSYDIIWYCLSKEICMIFFQCTMTVDDDCDQKSAITNLIPTDKYHNMLAVRYRTQWWFYTSMKLQSKAQHNTILVFIVELVCNIHVPVVPEKCLISWHYCLNGPTSIP